MISPPGYLTPIQSARIAHTNDKSFKARGNEGYLSVITLLMYDKEMNK